MTSARVHDPIGSQAESYLNRSAPDARWKVTPRDDGHLQATATAAPEFTKPIYLVRASGHIGRHGGNPPPREVMLADIMNALKDILAGWDQFKHERAKERKKQQDHD